MVPGKTPRTTMVICKRKTKMTAEPTFHRHLPVQSSFYVPSPPHTASATAFCHRNRFSASDPRFLSPHSSQEKKETQQATKQIASVWWRSQGPPDGRQARCIESHTTLLPGRCERRKAKQELIARVYKREHRNLPWRSSSARHLAAVHPARQQVARCLGSRRLLNLPSAPVTNIGSKSPWQTWPRPYSSLPARC